MLSRALIRLLARVGVLWLGVCGDVVRLMRPTRLTTWLRRGLSTALVGVTGRCWRARWCVPTCRW